MDKLPLDLRYFLTVVFSWMAALLYQKGWIGDQASFVSNATALAVAVVPFAAWAYARWVRPSNIGLEAANETDKVVAGEKTSAVVKTPGSQPDITIGTK